MCSRAWKASPSRMSITLDLHRLLLFGTQAPSVSIETTHIIRRQDTDPTISVEQSSQIG